MDTSSTHLTALGWDPATAAAFREKAANGAFALKPGRVGRVDRGRVTVHTATGATSALVRLGAGTRREEAPTTGDWVGLERRDDRAVVRVVLPRRTAIVRKVAGKGSDGQVMAANLDHVVIAVPFETRVNLARIERYLALAWESGAEPLVLLTKADLAYDPEGTLAEVAAAAPGATVRSVSAETGAGIEELGDVLAGGTAALIGQSGAGKSTLINVLTGSAGQLVAQTRQDGKGRHTTTARELILLPGGGVLIDTPGLREAGLHEDGEGVARTFPDVEELVARCRFSDCAHDTEPGCAIRAALEDGSLEQRRYDSWVKLQREAEWIARRADPVARAAARKRWAATGRAGRRRASLKRGEDPFG